MPSLRFDCVDVRADGYAAGPTLIFRLRISETTGAAIHALALRCQMRIEPHKRRYSPDEAERLDDLFGTPDRWADTLKPIQFTLVTAMVPSFTGSVEVDLTVACTYDLEVASTRYFASIDDGMMPLLMLFSGTVFSKGDSGFTVEPVPWSSECTARLPVAVWHQMMDGFFPGSGWLRLSRDTLDALGRYKSHAALATYEAAILKLLGEAPP